MSISFDRRMSFPSEDEVETPIFSKGGINGERRKDENDYVGSASVASWSKMHEKLIPDMKQPLKFQGMSSTKGKDLDSQEPPQLMESLLAVEYDSLEEASANPVEGLQENLIHESEDAISSKAIGTHESAKYSMADLLDGLQEKSCGPYAISQKRVRRKGRKRKVGVNRNTSVIEKRTSNDDDPCEIIDSESSSDDEFKDKGLVLTIVGPKEVNVNRNTSVIEKRTSNDDDPCEIIDSGSSSDDEFKDRGLVLTIVGPKKKTIADQFQEALGATSANEGALLSMPKKSRACSNGLLEKLHRVIQREKAHDMDFMQNVRSETLADEAGYIDVKLLSRSFEAKLTVCLCLINCYKKSSVVTEKSEEDMLMHTKKTIIFTSRICGDVELDVGSHVRVYSPWKEVQVVGGDIVILASYFSQTLT